MPVPVIDIFAGPGGLGEGFSALLNEEGQRVFKIALSVEMEDQAHETLTLRSFFRQFKIGEVPFEYYEFIKGKITLDQLYEKWPKQANNAKEEAWKAKLGEISSKEVDEKIDKALGGRKNWLLIGGPPCQAYSLVGRVRRQQTILDPEKDEKVTLYKQYLRILAIHNPAVFVMENVKGLLSAETKESPVFSQILKDLADPHKAYLSDFKRNGREMICPGYRIFSLTLKPKKFDAEGNPIFKQKNFIIHAEKYGIPQTRHRVILLGIRKGFHVIPNVLQPTGKVPISKVLSGLPRLRSGLSRTKGDGEEWKNAVKQILRRGILTGVDQEVKEEIAKQLDLVTIPHQGVGNDYIESDNVNLDPDLSDWFIDENIKGVCNHVSRGHMESDLLRYFFVSCFAKVKKTSPKLEHFPLALLPDHKNISERQEFEKFADRFRVQLWNKPSKTITCHISKDGHYYIHADPSQCRSFTVREAARIQTFPDNYYFRGPRTSQFTQVGNAVPPLLAYQIAGIVSEIFQNLRANRTVAHQNLIAVDE